MDPATPVIPASPAAAPSLPFKQTLKDVTPNQSRVHQVMIPAAEVEAFIVSVDPNAPVGKTPRVITVGFDGKGDLTLTITYNP